RACERIVIGLSPAMVGESRADDHARVRDAAGDHHVGALDERAGNAEGPEIGVRGERAAKETGMAEVVSRYIGYLQLEALGAGELTDLFGEPSGVETAGVADDLDASVDGETEGSFELHREGPSLSERGVLHRILAEDQHSELGE